MKKQPLLVPVTLDVLLLGNSVKEKPLADFTPEYRRLDDDDLFGDCVTNTGFASGYGKKGAHLHWTLPDALLNGEQDEDGSLVFPEVPNRWLVIRLRESEEGTYIERKVWVIESDAITGTESTTKEGISKTSIPCLVYDEKEEIFRPAGKDGAYYAYLGDVREYGTGKSKAMGYMDKLTAVGVGDHLFSAFYPLCRTVFGFYDSLAEEEAADFTYLVCGYYEKDTSDPFDYMSIDEIAQRFMWNWEQGLQQPDSVLCHGAAYHVQWQGEEHCYVQSPDKFLDLVLGNTSAEALACYLQNNISSDTDWERILNALQCGILEEYDSNTQADAVIELENSLHGRQFEYAGAGDNWKLQAEDAALADSFILADETKCLVREVTDMTEQLNQIRNLKASYAEESYLCWHRYISIIASPFGAKQEEEEAARDDLEEALSRFEEKEREEKDCEDKVKRLLADAEQKLSQGHLALKSVPSERFVRPNPPVLLMVEADTNRVCRQGEQKDADGLLPCRMSAVDKLIIELPEGKVSIETEEITKLWEDKLPDYAEALCAETVLLSPSYAPQLARIALDKAGVPCSDDRLKDAVSRVIAAQTAAVGRPFVMALKEWEMPWNPMMMEWQIEVTPASTKGTDNIFDYFELGDIDWEAKTTDFKGVPLTATGQTLLTPHAAVLMKEKLEDLLRDYGEGEIHETIESLIEKLGKRQIVSQQLTGFYEALRGLKYVPALPVLPYVERDETKELAVRVAKAANGIYPVTKQGMDSNEFMPILGGLIRLKKLRLIDTFGQYRDVALDKYGIAISESMRCDKEQTALLRPRFLSGVRMNYDWLSAGEDNAVSIDASSSPVFGFLLGNVFDQNFQVYDVDGNFLGWLQRTDQGVRWRSASGTALQPEEIKDEQLKRFVQGVLQWRSGQMEELIDHVDTHFSRRARMSPGKSQAVLLGSILALTRIQISMEEEGVPLKFWGAKEIYTNEYDREEFYIMLGDERRSRDGVVGFFPDADGRTNYSEAIYDHTVSMTLKDSERSFTLLLDPYGEVTVRSGFLPVQKERLAPELYQSQLEGMKLFLGLWPILSPEEELQLPMTELGGRKLEAVCVRKGEEAEICQIQHSLSDLLTESKLEAREVYLTWKKKEE